MLRSKRIPLVLSRVTGDGIHTALLVTAEGELLGSFHDEKRGEETSGQGGIRRAVEEKADMGSISALIAEVAGDYKRAGHELSFLRGSPGRNDNSLDQVPPRNAVSNHPLKCLLLDMENGMVGIASTAAYTNPTSVTSSDCFVALIGDMSILDFPGLMKARLESCAKFIGSELLKLSEHP